jgi:tetratricopeptide (TPR) repeat protein
MRISFSKFAALLLVLCFVALPALAQNRQIRGIVYNDKKEPIKDAKVVIQGTDVKREFKINTDKKGQYFCFVPSGEYRIIVRSPGFAPDYAQGIKPSFDGAEINFDLKPGDPVQKLPFEMSAQEIESLKQDIQKAEKQKQSSKEVKAAFDAGIAAAQAGNHEGAVVEFKKALEKDPDQPYIHANMADSLSKLGKFEESLAEWQIAITQKADDANFYINMGSVLQKVGKGAESQEAFKKAAALNPASAGMSFYNLGATLVNSGKTKEAADAFRQAIQSDPNYAEAYYQLGICLSGDPASMAEAVKSLQKYMEIGKNADQVLVAKQLVDALQPQQGEKVFKEEKKKKP